MKLGKVIGGIALASMALSSCRRAAIESGASRPFDGRAVAVAYCWYDVDVRTLPNPYARLGHLMGLRYGTCPFLAGQRAPARVYVVSVGASSCDPKPLSTLHIVRVTRITKADNNSDLASCLPMRHATDDAPAQGRIYMVEAPIDPDLQQKYPLGIASMAFRVVELSGLPVAHLDSRARGDVAYACFEMLPGANIDPLDYLRSTSEPVPTTATETAQPAPSCRQAFQAIGLE